MGGNDARADGGMGGLPARIAAAAADASYPEQVLELALAVICEAAGWPLGHAYIHDAGGAQLLPIHCWHPPRMETFGAFRRASDSRRFEPGEGLPGRVFADARPHWITDFKRDPGFARAEAAAADGLRAGFAFPIHTEEGVAAVLEFFDIEVRPPDRELLAAVGAAGEQIGRAFDRLRREEALRESENRFRALAETAADAIVSIDESDRIIYANPACERIFGYTREELAKLPFTRLMPERYRSRHREGLRRHVRTGERRIPWDGIELPGLHKDGSEVPLEVTFGSFQRNERHIFTGILRDMSDRKRAEEERRRLLEAEREARGEAERRAEQEAALREAATAVSSATTAEETVRRIAASALIATRADGAFVERICVEAGEVEVVAAAGDRVPPIGLRSPYEGSFVEQTVEAERPELLPRLADTDRTLPEGLRACWADCSAAVIPLLAAGEPVGALVLLRDPGKLGFRPDEVQRAFTFGELAGLAFRKIHLLEDAERRTEELQGVMESRSRLMRGFSHDVKNTLGAADGFLHLLEDGIFGPMTEEQLPKLGRARKALRSALALIDDLLDFARAEAGQLEIRSAPSDVREAAREITEDYGARAEEKGLDLALEVPDSFPVIESDPARIRQITANLLSNAVKYTPPRGRIVVRVEAREERVLLSVADTGPGIPAEKHHLLFQEFTRLDPEASDGAGIGLAISRRIAMALGGDIMLESATGKGSTFTLWLPLRRPGARARERPERPEREGSVAG
ncbi:MAG TPA: PAS domain S-box protein [Longimicrobiales bacterium]|nr:PAS domain S-box protein [Longimicrobiales bacterium]